MPNGGWHVKFLDSKGNIIEEHYCYKVLLDYDLAQYQINQDPPRKLPGLSKIEIIPEDDEY